MSETLRPQNRQQVETLLQRYEPEPDHVRQVAWLADTLFLGLRKWHKLKETQREWLQVAALLHDIGWSMTPTGSDHHRHSARLIRSETWLGLDRADVKLVALVARYHRKAIPQARHRRYAALAPADQKVVSILAGLLRVADALDRTHTAVVQSLAVCLARDTIFLDLVTSHPCVAEETAVNSKKDLLELVTDRRVVVTVSPALAAE